MKRWSQCRSVPSSQVIVAVPARTASGLACVPALDEQSWRLVAARGASNCRPKQVLHPLHRLRSSAEFAQTVRRGARVGRPTLVVHTWHRISPLGQVGRATLEPAGDDVATRVGFVVSRAVGGAVTRNRVKRQLRALSRPLVSSCPNSQCSVVIRALPAAVGQASRLPDDLSTAWASAMKKAAAT